MQATACGLASALTGAILTVQPALLVFACIGVSLLVARSAAVRRPLPTTLRSFQNHAVVVQLWGTSRSAPGGADLIVGSVNVIGAGRHVFFDAGSGRPVHLKVAQPRDATLSSRCVVINSAKYVQWSGTTLTRAENAPAVVVSLKESIHNGDWDRFLQRRGVPATVAN
jgi:hypothetical protein